MEIIIFVKRCKGTKEDWPLETKGIYTRFFISLIKKKREKKREGACAVYQAGRSAVHDNIYANFKRIPVVR